MRLVDKPDPNDPRVVRGTHDFDPDAVRPWWMTRPGLVLLLAALVMLAGIATVVIYA